MLHTMDFLIRFMPFARDQHDIARLRQFEDARYGLAPIRLDLDARPTILDLGSRIPDPGKNFLNDRRGLFTARVIGGDDGDVGELGRDPPHHRPLRAVAVRPTAEDDPPPAAREPPPRLE